MAVGSTPFGHPATDFWANSPRVYVSKRRHLKNFAVCQLKTKLYDSPLCCKSKFGCVCVSLEKTVAWFIIGLINDRKYWWLYFACLAGTWGASERSVAKALKDGEMCHDRHYNWASVPHETDLQTGLLCCMGNMTYLRQRLNKDASLTYVSSSPITLCCVPSLCMAEYRDIDFKFLFLNVVILFFLPQCKFKAFSFSH